MAPVAFVQRPLVWLRAISDYRAEVAGGPNFAFDLCVERYRPEQMAGIDLSGWKVAFNGAEPVRAEYDPRASARPSRRTASPPRRCCRPTAWPRRPCWFPPAGAAPGPVTRTVSRDRAARQRASRRRDDPDDAQRVVGCGRALAGERIAIVDPDTPAAARRRADRRDLGRRPECRARLLAEPRGERRRRSGRRSPARQARAGAGCAPAISAFSTTAGELFITGRIKDVIIIRGANHYPQDIEDTVQAGASGAAPARRRGLRGRRTANGEERLVVVQEVERTWRHRIDIDEIVGRIREAVVTEHEIVPYEIALLRPGALPKTTSGKIQRALSRKLWRRDRLTACSRNEIARRAPSPLALAAPVPRRLRRAGGARRRPTRLSAPGTPPSGNRSRFATTPS